MTGPETIRRLTALTVDATAAADRDDASLQRAAYERLREEALELNRRGEWASGELMAALLPSLSALDEIAALDAAYGTGADQEPGPHDATDATRIEALLRDVAAWATGVRTACELAEEMRGRD